MKKNKRFKKLNKQLSKRVYRALYKDSSFKDAYQMVCNKVRSQPYLVGGKLYRTLIETLYNYPARSYSCDFDFAAVDIVKPKGWNKKILTKRVVNFDGTTTTLEIPSPYKGDSITLRTWNGHKIDLISISDLGEIRNGNLPSSIGGYLGGVPLSIQSLAMDVDRCEIFGKVGIDSINEKYVWINNQAVLDDYAKFKGINADKFLINKAKSISFGYDHNLLKTKCTYKEARYFPKPTVPFNWFDITTDTANNVWQTLTTTDAATDTTAAVTYTLF